MASRSVIAARVQRSLEQIRDVLQRHDEEAGDRLKKAAGTTDEAVPPFSQSDLVLAYLSESVATLASLVDQRLTPRRRGRPRKDAL